MRIPVDIDKDNIYEFKINAVDEAGNESIQYMRVYVVDVDEESPVFHEPTTTRVNENQTDAIDLNVTDNNSSVIYYSLLGDDAGLFDIDSNGVVTFKTAPDYENPSDKDSNNIYEFIVTAKDEAGNESSQNITH